MTIICKAKEPKRRFSLCAIYGNCLEKLGVENAGGGYAIIDHNATVRVGDIVHCGKVTGQIGGYIKQVKEINGDSVIVGTAYFDESKDFQFEAAEIYGVVLETYGKTWQFREYARPTCKVGDMVYAFCKDFGVVLPYFVENLNIGFMDKDKNYLTYEANCHDEETDEFLDEIDFDLDDIGKTVFLTKEEAERALKEREKQK